ncbi:uncharacterized protein LOC130934416 [Arachis stenosperma]|uniref:uncharacterized protein LOC130934416 n=1 Tax=Arachis stenosperma TaxID=217475 RepID=UPI0025AD6D47|nr:uncharacterized protein LOC130934416 [Arachis stenosperma]
MKELLTKKRTLKEDETIVLAKEYGAIIQRKLPQILKDSGSFQILYTIGDITIGKALCDIGASINLMPLSMMKKMQIEEVKPTRISLQLTNRSIKLPHGVVENLLVKVGDFIFPADFVVLEIEESDDASIILGRPFLATRRALIDVQKGEQTLRVHDVQLSFNVFKTMQYPSKIENCMKIDLIDVLVKETIEGDYLRTFLKVINPWS